MLNNMLYAGDLVLVTETMDWLGIMFRIWIDAFENISFKVNLNQIVSQRRCCSGWVVLSKVYLCMVCDLCVMATLFCLKIW